jgi:predicted N-formylglutamate amidohydrolase
MINPESDLKTEYENAKILDYRDPLNPFNKIVITCEHATNDLPEDYSWSEHDQRHFVDEHWGIDIGAFEMAKELAAELKCVFVHSLYSRLLLDTNRSIVSDTLFRKTGDGHEVDLNKDLTYEEEQRRIKRFYIPYYEALREISTKVDPTIILSIHSFTPNYQGEKRSLEMGVLYGHDSTKFAIDVNEGMKNKGYYSEINKPYDGITTMGTVKSLIFAKHPSKRHGITFEFRNDILSDKERCTKLKTHTVEVVKDVCAHEILGIETQ